MDNHQGATAHPEPDILTSFEQENEALQRRIDEVRDRTLAFVRARPGSCLLGALALGFVVGKIAART